MTSKNYQITRSPLYQLVLATRFPSDQGIKMSSAETEDGLTSILKQGLVASAIIEIDLKLQSPLEGVIGFTTNNTVITWQLDGESHRYCASDVAVRFKESKEDLVQFDLYGEGSSKCLRFLIRLCNWPSLTSELKLKQLRPSRLEIKIAKLEVIAGTYCGEISSCKAIFETDKGCLSGYFPD